MHNTLLVAIVLAGCCHSLLPAVCLGQQLQQTNAAFEDVTASSGLDFVHDDGATGQQYLVELMAAGAASLDYDRDGRIDVYFCNGHRLEPQAPQSARGPGNALFRNCSRGDIRFTNVSSPSRANLVVYALGVTASDYDNDGFPDLAISTFGQNCLLRNNGDGTFSDVSRAAGIDGPPRFGAGINFADVDNDGDIDLFVANYVAFSFTRHAEISPHAFPYPPGPKDYVYLPDSLYLNQGDGTFTDAGERSGIGQFPGPGMGSIAGDFDRDGDIDIFVCCDGAPNHLYENDGHGRFVEAAFQWGVALDAAGNANGSMGVDAGDLNGDGYDDLLVTDYTRQWPMLFLSLAPGVYEDAARRTQIGTQVAPHVNWTAGLFDLENDGDLDALFCNGHFLRQARKIEPVTNFAVANTLMVNDGNLRFHPAPLLAADSAPGSSRGAVFEDFDQDGDIDVIILNCAGRAQVLENKTIANNYWLTLCLVGRQCNRSALGARVTLKCGNIEQTAEVRSGRGYQSHYGSQLHFGLGNHDQIDSLHVSWPDGSQTSITPGSPDADKLRPNRIWTIVQPAATMQ